MFAATFSCGHAFACEEAKRSTNGSNTVQRVYMRPIVPGFGDGDGALRQTEDTGVKVLI